MVCYKMGHARPFTHPSSLPMATTFPSGFQLRSVCGDSLCCWEAKFYLCNLFKSPLFTFSSRHETNCCRHEGPEDWTCTVSFLSVSGLILSDMLLVHWGLNEISAQIKVLLPDYKAAKTCLYTCDCFTVHLTSCTQSSLCLVLEVRWWWGGCQAGLFVPLSAIQLITEAFISRVLFDNWSYFSTKLGCWEWHQESMTTKVISNRLLKICFIIF